MRTMYKELVTVGIILLILGLLISYVRYDGKIRFDISPYLTVGIVVGIAGIVLLVVGVSTKLTEIVTENKSKSSGSTCVLN